MEKEIDFSFTEDGYVSKIHLTEGKTDLSEPTCKYVLTF